MEEIKKSQKAAKNLGKGISDLKSSLVFTENMLEEKVQRLEEKYRNLENRYQEPYDTNLEPAYVYNKLVDLEDRSKLLQLKNRLHSRN